MKKQAEASPKQLVGNLVAGDGPLPCGGRTDGQDSNKNPTFTRKMGFKNWRPHGESNPGLGLERAPS